MSLHRYCLISTPSISLLSLLLLLLLFPPPRPAFGYGSAGPIAAAFGENGFFCAIDASGKQEIVCWDKQNKYSTTSSSTTPSYLSSLPSMAALAGGEGFMCGIASNSSKPYCWDLAGNFSGKNLVPEAHRRVLYSEIAPGKDHVCGLKGEYFSKTSSGNVDCWKIDGSGEDLSVPYGVGFSNVVSGEGFSCGVAENGGVLCWGRGSEGLGTSSIPGSFEGLASGRRSVCGIVAEPRRGVKCWGDSSEFGSPPVGNIDFVRLSAGGRHYCGVRKGDHGVLCWGDINSSASVPKGAGFMAIASADFTTCGVREADLVLDCWGVRGLSRSEYSPPLQLCSPGVCSRGPCGAREFAYNASALNEPGLGSLCARKDLKLCLPCGTSCSEGYFPSSVCGENVDRVCTACSLCQNSSCSEICKISPDAISSTIRDQERKEIMKKFIVIFGSLLAGSLLVFIFLLFLTRISKTKDNESGRISRRFCMGKQAVEADPEANSQASIPVASCIGTAQAFRLSELKDATNGFKEYNELGRGNFGFVYKAVLTDGTSVAVKRANAATIIHTNVKEFEADIEILSHIRHPNIVNLLGFCAEMGERLLVYEYMPHGTLRDHLHGELPPLDWNLRLKIALQAAKGLEYLHAQVKPVIVHGDVKTSNILLDGDSLARVSDFGLSRGSVEADGLNGGLESDVYAFGIVLLEILTGRKALDRDFSPPGIADWAVPVIRRGKAAAVIDRSLALPRSFEPLLRLAEAAEFALRENPGERPSMSELVGLLDQAVKSSGVAM